MKKVKKLVPGTWDVMPKALRAIELHRLILQAEAELNQLKDDLRASAEATPWRELVTPEGSVRVAFVDPAMGPRKDKDGLVSLSPALAELTPAHFALLFSARTVVALDVKECSDFAVRLKLLSPDERRVVKSLVEEKPGQIRVTLPARK